MKLLLCIAILLGGCSISKIRSYKKPDNNIPSENLQEKFTEIDSNKDGVLDKAEIKKYEEQKPAHADAKTPAVALFQILGFVLLLCILPKSLSFAWDKISDFRNKKRV